MQWNIILTSLGFLMIIDSMVIFLYPRWAMKIGKSLFKSESSLIKVGKIELFLAVFLIFIGMNI